MWGRRRLSVTASLTMSCGIARGIETAAAGPRASTCTVEASRREAHRRAPVLSHRTLGGRIARRRAIAEAARGAG